MLELKNKTLKSVGEEINSSDYILRLKSDIKTTILGLLILPDGTFKTVQFIDKDDESDIKIARIITTDKEFPYINKMKFQLVLINGTLEEKTNIIPLKFNKELIKTDIKKALSNEYKELMTKYIALDDKINAIKLGNFVQKIDVVNKDVIKPGMIPVAVDNEGHFTALYPFANNITNINGQQAANGVVVIDASMIKCSSNKTIEQTFSDTASAIKALNNLVTEVINNQKEIRKKLDDLDVQISQHINNGIV